jgi:hypothetical protein
MFRALARSITKAPTESGETSARCCRSPVTRSWRKRLQWLLFVLACSAPGAASAQELALTWQAAEGCPDADWAHGRLNERLGRALADRAQDPLAATATLAREGERFVLTLHTVQAGVAGDRALAASSCAELAEAAVLVLALAIDPDAVARIDEGAAQRVAELDSERPPFLTPAAQRPAIVEPARARPWAVRADALLALGPLPGVTAGPSLAIAYQWTRLRAELSGYWLWPREGHESDAPGSVRVSLWALRPTMCVRLLGQRVQLSGCAALELGRIHGRGLDLPIPQESQALWPAASLAPRLAIAAGNMVFFQLELGLVAALVRPRFVSTDGQGRALTALYEASPLAGRATLGVELRF